jgi:hypothetical protein
MSYWKLNEDPFYDEDGVLIDEDADWEDINELVDSTKEAYGPFETINS